MACASGVPPVETGLELNRLGSLHAIQHVLPRRGDVVVHFGALRVPDKGDERLILMTTGRRHMMHTHDAPTHALDTKDLEWVGLTGQCLCNSNMVLAGAPRQTAARSPS